MSVQVLSGVGMAHDFRYAPDLSAPAHYGQMGGGAGYHYPHAQQHQQHQPQPQTSFANSNAGQAIYPYLAAQLTSQAASTSRPQPTTVNSHSSSVSGNGSQVSSAASASNATQPMTYVSHNGFETASASLSPPHVTSSYPYADHAMYGTTDLNPVQSRSVGLTPTARMPKVDLGPRRQSVSGARLSPSDSAEFKRKASLGHPYPISMHDVFHSQPPRGISKSDDEDKKARRKEQNRLAQQDLRRRRFEHAQFLENKVAELMSQLEAQHSHLALLQAENAELRENLRHTSVPSGLGSSASYTSEIDYTSQGGRADATQAPSNTMLVHSHSHSDLVNAATAGAMATTPPDSADVYKGLSLDMHQQQQQYQQAAAGAAAQSFYGVLRPQAYNLSPVSPKLTTNGIDGQMQANGGYMISSHPTAMLHPQQRSMQQPVVYQPTSIQGTAESPARKLSSTSSSTASSPERRLSPGSRRSSSGSLL